MRWVSFSWTTPALVAGHKTVTRRDYRPEYAAQFRAGDHVMAVDAQPRYGGSPIAVLRLTRDCRLEPDADAPSSDYEAEGFAFLRELARTDPEKLPKKILRDLHRGCWSRADFDRWRLDGGEMHVLRFETVKVLVTLDRIRYGRVIRDAKPRRQRSLPFSGGEA